MIQTTEKLKKLKRMLGEEGISFRSEEGWNTLAEHVDVHSRLIAESAGNEISWEEALLSWFEKIYSPLKSEIEHERLESKFKGMSSGELYLSVSDHWFYIKTRAHETEAREAVKSFKALNKPVKNSFFSRIFGISDELYSGSNSLFDNIFTITDEVYADSGKTLADISVSSVAGRKQTAGRKRAA